MTKARKARPARKPTRRIAPDVTVAVTPWDMGATGQANRHGLIAEDAAEFDPETGEARNPNGVKRMRRVDMLEVWHRKGRISTAGFNAAEKLRDAFEQTGRAPGWPDNDRVQSSPKPDHAVAIQISRISKFHDVAKLVCIEDRPIIDAVVLGNRIPAALRHYRNKGYADGMDHLRAALDRLAERINRGA
jgi:hypothetical protein